MATDADRPLSVSQRRRAMRCAYGNGAVWAVGNGLASTTLVVYLAMELGAQRIGLGIGMILAMRHLVGLLRLGAPAVIGRWVDRKRFCLGCFLLAAVVLLSLPSVAAPGRLASAEASLATLVVLWCVYHVLQYLGMVALWSWLADLAPLRIRGRFLGRRERWMVSGTAVGALTCGLFTWWWRKTFTSSPGWIAYALPTVVGGCFMIASLLPLARIPRLATSRIVRLGATWASMLAPFADRRFQRLLLFGCWFSLSNGLTQSAQFSYPRQILAAGTVVFAMLYMQTGMRIGQLAVSPFLGRLADRAGNRPVMIGSLLLVAQGPLFYFFATREQPWWLVGAWTVWIAYAGLNVCLPNLMLKLSPGESNTPYIATYYTVTCLCYAFNTIVGGALSDRFGESTFCFFGGVACGYYRLLFLAGWIARSLGLIVLLCVIEGDARQKKTSKDPST